MDRLRMPFIYIFGLKGRLASLNCKLHTVFSCHCVDVLRFQVLMLCLHGMTAIVHIRHPYATSLKLAVAA